MDDAESIARLNAALAGAYRIERELGEGGMATVYLAEDLRHERKVALKVLKPQLAAVVGAERFLAEIKTTANLQHPNILPLHDSGEADGLLFYVMPYVEGESLRHRLDREKQLPVDEALRITSEVADALQAAHEQGVIHRDVKPANILLSRGRPFVADFGIALAVSAAGGGRLTETGLSMGTPYYMSPEQAAADREPTAASDVYSLGCVLYEMLVGDPPYTASSAQGVLAKILTAPAPRATEYRRAIPVNVDAAVRRALEKLPADRFAQPRDLASALQDPRYRYDEVPARTEARAPSRRSFSEVAPLALAALLAVALAWSVLARPESAGPVTEWSVALVDDLSLLSDQGVNVDLSGDASRIVFVGIDEDENFQLWLRNVDQLEPEPLAGTEGAQNPRFSPDGEEVAFIAGQSLRIASLDGSPVRTIVPDSVDDESGGLAWGADGMIYYRRLRGGLWRLPAVGGVPEALTSLASPSDHHQWPDVLPEGRGLLYTYDDGATNVRRIAVLASGSQEPRFLAEGTTPRYSRTGHVLYATAEGTLSALPFDIGRLRETGPPRPVIQGVGVGRRGAATFAVAAGTLVYRPGQGVVLGTSGGGGVPRWIHRDGTVEELPGMPEGMAQAPAISPDGGRIAFEFRPIDEPERDIWVYDIGAGRIERRTFGPGENRRPFWHPDGERIGFSWLVDGVQSLYTIAADGSEREPRLLRGAAGEGTVHTMQEAIWTPDGQRLVYRRGGVTVAQGDFIGAASLHLAPAHPESASVALGDPRFTWYEPAISPDGRYIAYTSGEGGQPQVWVEPFLREGRRTVVSGEESRSPVWSRDGNELFFQLADRTLAVASVRTDAGLAVLEATRHPDWPRPFAGNPTQHFDVAPDGRVLIIDPGESGTDVRDIVVQNFDQRLRELVSSGR